MSINPNAQYRQTPEAAAALKGGRSIVVGDRPGNQPNFDIYVNDSWPADNRSGPGNSSMYVSAVRCDPLPPAITYPVAAQTWRKGNTWRTVMWDFTSSFSNPTGVTLKLQNASGVKTMVISTSEASVLANKTIYFKVPTWFTNGSYKIVVELLRGNDRLTIVGNQSMTITD